MNWVAEAEDVVTEEVGHAGVLENDTDAWREWLAVALREETDVGLWSGMETAVSEEEIFHGGDTEERVTEVAVDGELDDIEDDGSDDDNDDSDDDKEEKEEEGKEEEKEE